MGLVSNSHNPILLTAAILRPERGQQLPTLRVWQLSHTARFGTLARLLKYAAKEALCAAITLSLCTAYKYGARVCATAR